MAYCNVKNQGTLNTKNRHVIKKRKRVNDKSICPELGLKQI